MSGLVNALGRLCAACGYPSVPGAAGGLWGRLCHGV